MESPKRNTRRDGLNVGPCHSQTGRERFGVPSDTTIPWETPGLVPNNSQNPAPQGQQLDGFPWLHSTDNSDDDEWDHTGDDADFPFGVDGMYPDPAPLMADPAFEPMSDDDLSAYFQTGLVPETGPQDDTPEVAPYVDAAATPDDATTTPINTTAPAHHDNMSENMSPPPESPAHVDDDGDGWAPSPDGTTTFGPLTFDDDDSDSDASDSSKSSDSLPVPAIANYRLNLTALSQQYNIYAAAYGAKIHIFRVRSCVDHALPASPNLIIEPPPSRGGSEGYIDRLKPHQANHLIMGSLGNMEILLLALDDGDVIAYYTSHIETAISDEESSRDSPGGRKRPLRPFFHHNVGRSAWGLAVHQKSRLIAVGNNRHEVQVFAFALNDPAYITDPDLKRHGFQKTCENEFLTITKNVDGLCSIIDHDLFSEPDWDGTVDFDSNLSHSRERAYRFVLETGRRGHHIPNVAFGNNPDGDAVDVLAVDIRGNLWVMDIWSVMDSPPTSFDGIHVAHAKSMQRLQGVPTGIRPLRPNRGWGVLVLPESSFLPTKNFRHSLGLEPQQAAYVCHDFGYCIGIGKAASRIKDNSTTHPWARSGQLHRFNRDQFHSVETFADWYHPAYNLPSGWNCRQDADVDFGRPVATRVKVKRERMTDLKRPLLADGSSVMRTYEMDVELLARSPEDTGIVFDNVIRQTKPVGLVSPGLGEVQRLANLLHVPELSLVVAGSMCGRVALITLTRPMNPGYTFQRGFKVEAILPKQSDEDQFRRPMCSLLGVAIGPIPAVSGNGTTTDGLLDERRYRIMLHYYDHTILSYEVYRNLSSGALSIFPL